MNGVLSNHHVGVIEYDKRITARLESISTIAGYVVALYWKSWMCRSHVQWIHLKTNVTLKIAQLPGLLQD
jgi:hypothetical protein